MGLTYLIQLLFAHQFKLRIIKILLTFELTKITTLLDFSLIILQFYVNHYTTTDLGLTDHYVSAIKASIIRQLDNVKIVDISHQMPTFNVVVAFVLKNVYKEFHKNNTYNRCQ